MNYRQNKDLYRSLNNEQTIKTNLNFGKSTEELKTDISTTYLGQVNVTRNTELKAEENFPMTAIGYTRGHLLDGIDCDVLIDTGASKSYMSK